MSSKFGKDLSVGSIPGHLLAFSIPMLFGNLLQIGYGIINTIWVGNIIGKDAVGATTVGFQIILILIGLASGASSATTILVSQYYGAKDYKKVERIVNNAFTVTLILGSILTIGSILASDFILRAMNTPEEVFVIASSYVKISLASFIFTFIGYLIASIMIGIGDTITPLTFMLVGVGLNAVLDPLLIIGVGPFPELGLNGAAYASLISQAVAITLGLFYMNRKKHIISIHPKKFNLDKKITFMVFKIGFPQIVQQTLVSIGAAVITTLVNNFGASAIDAYGAASRVDSIAFLPAMSLGMAVSALTGQNMGARKPERIKEIFKWGIIMTAAVTVVISILALTIPGLILAMFGLGRHTHLMDIGISYLRIVGSCYILFALTYVSNGVINGSGHTITTMVYSLFSIWVIRVFLALVLSRTHLGTSGIWLAISISFAVLLAASLVYYYSGRWKIPVIKRERPSQV